MTIAQRKEYFLDYVRYGPCCGGPCDGRWKQAFTDRIEVKEETGRVSFYIWDREQSKWLWRLR